MYPSIILIPSSAAPNCLFCRLIVDWYDAPLLHSRVPTRVHAGQSFENFVAVSLVWLISNPVKSQQSSAKGQQQKLIII
jgi:hypothetical protein